MMKVLILLGGYLPAKHYGGPVTSMKNLVEHLGQDISFQIIASNHDFGSTEPLSGISSGWNTVGKANVLYLPDSDFSVKCFSDIIEECSPDLLYMSSIFYHKMNMPAFLAARKHRVPIVLCPRGELDINALRIGYQKKRLYITLLRSMQIYKNLFFHATCKEEALAIEKTLHVIPSRIFTIPNLPASPQRKKVVNKQPGKLSIIICSRIVPNKNQLVAIKAVCKLTGSIECDIFGPIQDKTYWRECCEAISKAPSNVLIRYKGELSSEDVHKELLKHDCFLLPTAFENYGHAVSEAILHDCPPVISRGTTPWDDLQDYKAGYTVPLSSPDGFSNAINELCNMDTEKYRQLLDRLRDYTQRKILLEKDKSEYFEMFHTVMIDNQK